MAQPKLQKLAKKLQKKPMTYSEIKKFLGGTNRSSWDTSLYGTTFGRLGFFKRFDAYKTADGKWTIPGNVVIQAPFTTAGY